MQIQEPEFRDGKWVRRPMKCVGGQWVEVEPQQFGILPMGEKPPAAPNPNSILGAKMNHPCHGFGKKPPEDPDGVENEV